MNRTRLEIAAPERAKVISVLYELGELVSPNAPAVLFESERRYVDVYVAEDQVGGFTEGTEVPCYVPAIDRIVTGKVQTTDAAPDFADLKMVRERGQADLKLFKVRIEIPATEGLLAGMTVEVRP